MATATGTQLDIRDLSKGFTLHAAGRRVRGCEHISLAVGHGEFVGIRSEERRVGKV